MGQYYTDSDKEIIKGLTPETLSVIRKALLPSITGQELDKGMPYYLTDRLLHMDKGFATKEEKYDAFEKEAYCIQRTDLALNGLANLAVSFREEKSADQLAADALKDSTI